MNNTATCKYTKNCLRHFPYVKKNFRNKQHSRDIALMKRGFAERRKLTELGAAKEA